MTPEERKLITDLFDRMRGFSLPQKDGEAEALINERVRAIPDSAYMLVQSVLVQEHALQEADKRIKALEDQVRAAQADAPERAAGSGSFLGGLFGGARPASEPARSGGSVPQVGARATPSVYDRRQSWTQGEPQQSAPIAQAGGPGGGFLQTAMATATGVAGGMLVAGAIGSLLGGSSSADASPANAAPAEASPAPDTSASANETASAEPAPSAAQEDASQDVADEDGGWFGDMGDFEL